MRRAIPHALALVLGVCAALLVACGGDGPAGGIPSANADELKKELSDVEDFVQRGDCGTELQGQLRQVREQLDNLPASVDDALRQTLADAVARLDAAALDECAEQDDEPVETTEEPQETVTQTVPTVTEPAPTTTAEPAPEQPEPAPEQPEPAPDEPAPGQGQGPGSGGTPPEEVP